MLLVNNPGSWDAIYPPLEHAPWHGWTPTDLIFPFFLFIVGITTEISLTRRATLGASDSAIRQRILVRGALIVLFGLLLTAFPFFPLTRLTEIRIPGVLQRIGVCYAIGALLSWRRTDRAVAVTAAVLLLGYWATLVLVPAPGLAVATIDQPDQTIAAYLDRALLGRHLWATSKTWDPEGPLSTIPAIGTVLLGVLTARLAGRAPTLAHRLNTLFGLGAVAIVVGLCWNWVLPINKNLWTSSYVVFTAGAAATVLATVTWIAESHGLAPWGRPFATFGTNPMLAFLGSGLMARLIGSVITIPADHGRVSLQQAIYWRGFASWASPVNASLLYAVSFVLLWYLILHHCERRGWFIKV